MSLFLIIYTAGVIGGAAGPLPYDMDECVVRRNEMRAAQTVGLERGINVQTGLPMTDAERAGVESLSFECEYRDTRPQLGEVAGG
jgi:hypothetical protein